jgi:hypothetical protein
MDAKLKEFRKQATGVAEHTHRTTLVYLAAGMTSTASVLTGSALELFQRGHNTAGTMVAAGAATVVAGGTTVTWLLRKSRNNATLNFLVNLTRREPENEDARVALSQSATKAMWKEFWGLVRRDVAALDARES